MRRRQHAWPVGLLACSVVQGLSGGLALAATYPVGALTFPIGPLDFPSSLTASETANTIEVTLPADILFDFDKAEIRRDAQGPLHEAAELLRDKARGPVMIQGYTDALGNDAYNQRLSERRARAVKTWFATREGLASMKFLTSGYGARNPVAPNRDPDGSDNPAGRQLNRRVMLIIPK
jgi:outer membrane protein OmpA-like peptidoglycan-associated protein